MHATRDVSKLLRKGTQFFASFCLLFALLMWVSITLAPPPTPFEARLRLLMSRLDAEAITIGHSHSNAILFSALGMNGFHLFGGGMDLFETELILKHVVPKMQRLRYVFIPIAYWSLQWDNGTLPTRQERRVSMYRSLLVAPLRGDLLLYLESRIRGVVRTDNWEWLFHSLQGEKPRFEELDPESGRNMSVQNVPSTRLILNRHAEKAARTHMDTSRAMAQVHGSLEGDTEACLVRILTFLKAREIEPIVYTPPYSQEYISRYDDAAIHAMTRSITAVCLELDLPYYNFSGDPEFIHDPTLFANSDHLNRTGAAAFSEKLKKAIYTRHPPETPM